MPARADSHYVDFQVIFPSHDANHKLRLRFGRMHGIDLVFIFDSSLLVEIPKIYNRLKWSLE